MRIEYQKLAKLIFRGTIFLSIGIEIIAVQAQSANKTNQDATLRANEKKPEIEKALTTTGKFQNIKIKNFGQMDQRFYRGAQPRKDDYQSLKNLGVKTVIDLRDDPTSYEKPAVEALGMKYINIPMSDSKYPKAPSIEEFLKLANDPQTGIFFVHCEGGRHRTGVIGAVYRLTKYNWSYEQAYQEMKKYDFYTRWGHGPLKDFVADYAEKLKPQQPKSQETNVSPAARKRDGQPTQKP